MYFRAKSKRSVKFPYASLCKSLKAGNTHFFRQSGMTVSDWNLGTGTNYGELFNFPELFHHLSESLTCLTLFAGLNLVCYVVDFDLHLFRRELEVITKVCRMFLIKARTHGSESSSKPGTLGAYRLRFFYGLLYYVDYGNRKFISELVYEVMSGIASYRKTVGPPTNEGLKSFPDIIMRIRPFAENKGCPVRSDRM